MTGDVLQFSTGGAASIRRDAAHRSIPSARGGLLDEVRTGRWSLGHPAPGFSGLGGALEVLDAGDDGVESDGERLEYLDGAGDDEVVRQRDADTWSHVVDFFHEALSCFEHGLHDLVAKFARLVPIERPLDLGSPSRCARKVLDGALRRAVWVIGSWHSGAFLVGLASGGHPAPASSVVPGTVRTGSDNEIAPAAGRVLQMSIGGVRLIRRGRPRRSIRSRLDQLAIAVGAGSEGSAR